MKNKKDLTEKSIQLVFFQSNFTIICYYEI